MLRRDCLLVSKHTKYKLLSVQFYSTETHIFENEVQICTLQRYMILQQGFTQTYFLQPLSKQTTTSLVQLNYIRERISVLKQNGQFPKLPNYFCLFLFFSSPSFFFFFEETPIHKMKIISGYFLQWWTKQFLKTRHQFALHFQMP